MGRRRGEGWQEDRTAHLFGRSGEKQRDRPAGAVAQHRLYLRVDRLDRLALLLRFTKS